MNKSVLILKVNTNAQLSEEDSVIVEFQTNGQTDVGFPIQSYFSDCQLSEVLT